MKTARVIQVIETTSTIGEGIPENIMRTITEYWDLEGNLLATHDPVVNKEVN